MLYRITYTQGTSRYLLVLRTAIDPASPTISTLVAEKSPLNHAEEKIRDCHTSGIYVIQNYNARVLACFSEAQIAFAWTAAELFLKNEAAKSQGLRYPGTMGDIQSECYQENSWIACTVPKADAVLQPNKSTALAAAVHKRNRSIALHNLAV